MNNPKIGLLPFYVELYDRYSPEIRPRIDAFYKQIALKLKEAGLIVEEVPVCRLAEEFDKAILLFEQKDVDALVTLHLAYSPSLESEEALKKTKLPIIVLDTTPDYSFDHRTDQEAVSYNHGIHGVQDMCNLLLRNDKKFIICAGHFEHSDVLARTVSAARAAKIVRLLRKARVGLAGQPFKGMGDFSIPFEEMKRDLGITVIPYDPAKGRSVISGITEEEIRPEYERDTRRFNFDVKLSKECYERSAKTALGIRKWVKDERLSAFSINFNDAGEKNGLPVMPFVECATAMSEGIGYAGEGDVLTAAFTGALLSVYKDTTFTEMFCPDWEHGSIYMSHMGEFNYALSAEKPFLTEKPFPYTAAGNPMVAYGTLKSGEALLINLAPFGKGKYGLIAVPGEMLPVQGENRLNLSVNGWFKPRMELPDLLESYSRYGGTHHSVLVYGGTTTEMISLGKFMHWDTHVL
jgi:L-arabinose isomerase